MATKCDEKDGPSAEFGRRLNPALVGKSSVRATWATSWPALHPGRQQKRIIRTLGIL
jgi:hypothetical protein